MEALVGHVVPQSQALQVSDLGFLVAFSDMCFEVLGRLVALCFPGVFCKRAQLRSCISGVIFAFSPPHLPHVEPAGVLQEKEQHFALAAEPHIMRRQRTHRCAPDDQARLAHSYPLLVLTRLNKITGSRSRAPFAGNLSTLKSMQAAGPSDMAKTAPLAVSADQGSQASNIDRHILLLLASRSSTCPATA